MFLVFWFLCNPVQIKYGPSNKTVLSTLFQSCIYSLCFCIALYMFFYDIFAFSYCISVIRLVVVLYVINVLRL